VFRVPVFKRLGAIATGLVLAGLAGAAGAQPADPLAHGFQTPPASARPRVWWPWMNGNITREGIRQDLEWLRRIGIGGVDCIDASLVTPRVVDKPLTYMSPDWRADFRYAAGLADKLGLELSIDSSPGWSETGGPWVTPEAAMKKLVWSRTELDGGQAFHGQLPRPPDTAGPIQNIPIASGALDTGPTAAALKYYRDSVVVAYREPVPTPSVDQARSSAGPFDPASLSDGDLTNGLTLTPAGGDLPTWIDLTYAQPVRIQGLTLAVGASGARGADARLEVSDDRGGWRTIADIPAATLAEQTVSVPPTTGQLFRLTFTPAAAKPLPGIFTNYAPGAAIAGIVAALAPRPAPLAFHVHELALRTEGTVNQAEAKAGFAIAPDNYAIATPPDVDPASVVASSDVQILTDRMRPDGTLDWTPPPGRWVVLRMGYSLTGTENHPAADSATGLEVDKLDAGRVRQYLKTYLGLYADAAGPSLFGRRGLNALTIDSTEIGAQNWTEDMLADFQRLRGYDPRPWLPTLTGVVVGSPQDSDKFLWDFRRTLAELLATNHYGEVAAAVHARGMVNYAEALEDHRASFGDDLEMRRYADVPMGAMWMYGSRREPYPTYVADVRGAASIAHIYGQNLVGVESMDSAGQPWAYAPRQLKPVVDMEFALGANRIVIHTSPHQPLEKPPGLSLFVFGQFFDRLETWADEAGPWVSYMARSSYLLQQGRYAADIAYFYGQEAPVTGLFGDRPVTEVPQGYGFDFVNSDVLINQLSVDADEDLVTRGGMRYRLLYLGGSSRYMTLPVLRRIGDLVAEGAVVVGRRPIGSPSLADDPAQFQALAETVFGQTAAVGDHAYGRGRVFGEGALDKALGALKLAPDFDYSRPEADTELLALHRRLDDGDLYFVTNRLDRPEQVTASFRVSGRSPELWNAVTGTAAPADFRMADGRTQVALALGPYESVFVVFRKPAPAVLRTAPLPVETTLATLNGPWRIAFQPGRGAPVGEAPVQLGSWTQSAAPGVRYFSGDAVYRNAFVLPAGARRPGARVMLDLGDVRELAEVRLNGRPLGVLWTPPFRIDITDAVRPGVNRLEVKVTNLWVNRLIGDAQPGATKTTFTTIPTYNADAPLRPSGLLGPVRIEQVMIH
jgi:hypothetical protein